MSQLLTISDKKKKEVSDLYNKGSAIFDHLSYLMKKSVLHKRRYNAANGKKKSVVSILFKN